MQFTPNNASYSILLSSTLLPTIPRRGLTLWSCCHHQWCCLPLPALPSHWCICHRQFSMLRGLQLQSLLSTLFSSSLLLLPSCWVLRNEQQSSWSSNYAGADERMYCSPRTMMLTRRSLFNVSDQQSCWPIHGKDDKDASRWCTDLVYWVYQ